ncbi:LysR family transcriptional regulator [Acinetobacter larvae]|uniref:LysR family transcriptional regulator n=2 Tax=Acinetobacter larvae TaxID=1789224 RepID=A0A1B2LZR2_9GAMM|nr:LysR family transcriptional regulator [Acinetobacter larvae]
MQLKSLQVFLTVIEQGSFSAAAQSLHTVQSNITNHIKKLEAELQCELISRQQPIRITSAGQQLQHYATQILQLHQDALNHFLHQNQQLPDVLNIGSMETTAAFRLPELFHQIKQQYPQLRLNVLSQPSRQLIDAVLAHELDCAFIANSHPLPNLYNLPIWQEKLVLVMAKHIELELCADQLMQHQFIVFRQGCSYRHSIENLLAYYNLPSSLMVEMGSLDGIMGCVSLGMGLSILPEAYVNHTRYSDRLKLVPIEEHIAQVTTYLIAQRPETWRSGMHAFMSYMQKH